MSQVICNSGPLIALGLLGRLELLKSLFDVVLVPEAVQKEIGRGGIKLAGLEDFRRADWIQVLPLQGKRDALLESLLDVGEAAVISLAREQQPPAQSSGQRDADVQEEQPGILRRVSQCAGDGGLAWQRQDRAEAETSPPAGKIIIRRPVRFQPENCSPAFLLGHAPAGGPAQK